MEPSPPSPPPVAPAGASRPRPDPEFAADPFPAAAFPPGFDPAEHQHLVVNPFLAVVALIAWGWATRRLFATSFPPAALLPTLALAGLPFLVHNHCTDCGVTEPFPRWRRHACARVVLRGRSPSRSRWRLWPTARTQLILWGYILGAVGLLVAVVVLLAGA